MSHTIYICTIQDKDHCNLITAAIVNMGVNVSVAADNGALFAENNGKKTTIMAVSVNNFNTKFSNSELLDRICNAISKYDYYGIVLKNSNGGSSWDTGNVSFKDFERSLSKAEGQKRSKSNKKSKEKAREEPKSEPKVDEPKKVDESKPQPEGVKRIDLKLLTTIVKCSCSMSDTFFDGTTQADRKLLLRELETLCENSDASIEDVVK